MIGRELGVGQRTQLGDLVPAGQRHRPRAAHVTGIEEDVVEHVVEAAHVVGELRVDVCALQRQRVLPAHAADEVSASSCNISVRSRLGSAKTNSCVRGPQYMYCMPE